MELKRTARDITGNCRDFPGQKNVRIGIQAAAGYAFAMGILEKYRQAEGYDLPSASFVYPDARREEEDREAVRELAAHLSFINRIHISYLNQSYERNYYWNMRLRCEQLFLRLSGSTVFGREVRELREIYQELAREQEAASAQTADRERLSEGPGQGEADRRESFPEEERERTRKKEQRLGEILRQTEQKIMKRAVTGILKKDFMDRLPSRQASASWQSEPARQFFWQVQRSPRWEQEILFRAAGVGSLPALEKRLARIPEKRWGRELEILKETTPGHFTGPGASGDTSSGTSAFGRAAVCRSNKGKRNSSPGGSLPGRTVCGWGRQELRSHLAQGTVGTSVGILSDSAGIFKPSKGYGK